MTRPDGLDLEAFADSFLDAYLEDGFANMPKKEIDLTVLQLLLQHTESWSLESPPNAFHLAKQLRAKRQKIRSMLDEISFRNAGNDEHTKQRLRTLLKKAERVSEGRSVKVQIEDAYLREFAKSLVQEEFGLVDSSFDRSIISLSGEKFALLAYLVMEPKVAKAIEAELEKAARPEKISDESKSLRWRMFEGFLVEASKSSGKVLGDKGTRLGFAILTGGVSEFLGLTDGISNNDTDEAEG